METIKLTKEHKSKLLEICKVLFPEYTEYKWDIIHCTDCIKYNGILFMYKKDGSNDEFHWFEFCTKIGHEIFSRKQFYYQSEEFITFMKIMCLQDKSKLKHPVDYLYEEFKKLKL